MILRLAGLAALVGVAVPMFSGVYWPLAVAAIVVMLSLPLLDRAGYHPQGNRGWRS